MQTFQITLELQSAFATPLKGDTLFGQLCWAIRNRFGEPRLEDCLADYTQGQPFLVMSDAFPDGYVPLPKLPTCCYRTLPDEDRKAIKKRTWLPIEAVNQPLPDWLGLAQTPGAISGEANGLSEGHPQPHNTINRQTNTTGEEGFAPFSIAQEWYWPKVQWMLYAVLDTQKLSADELQRSLNDIGLTGFGRDASIGLGKFKITRFNAVTLPQQPQANACLTLGPCLPQGQGYDGQNSYYSLFTRFGRHGDIAVHKEGRPFKNPILMAQTGAVFTITPPESGFIGQGVGADGSLSNTLSATVHQGYAPFIAVHIARRESI